MKAKIVFLLIGILIIGTFEYSFGQELGYGSDFHDFTRQFFSDSEKQVESISFPLVFIVDNDTSFIKRNDWKILDYCIGCEFSTILFMKDSINSNAGYYSINENNDCVISMYLKPEKKIQNFHFSKTEKSWTLDQIFNETLTSGNEESFFEFIDKFSSDTEFIEKRLTSDFVTAVRDWDTNPKNKKELPFKREIFESHDYLFERVYIYNLNLDTDSVIIKIKGEGTGYNLKYYFTRMNGKWYFSKHYNLGV